VDRWEQIAPDRWRFYLRDGVKFHNGETWDAAAAAFSLDWFGSIENANSILSYAGNFSSEVVDDLTVDVVCVEDCPIFPRTGFMIWFQAPEWYSQADQVERSGNTVGFGPYEITSYRPGIDIGLTAYEDYLPNTAWDAQAPTIREITMVWREEPLVRAAMVETDEAQWTMGLGAEQEDNVPVFISGGAGETFVNVFDALWHPELKKLKVRQALAHAVDCETMLEALYQGTYECWGSWAPEGTLGLTAHNTAPYAYDPDLSRELLQEAGYDSDNEIVLFVFAGRFFLNTEVAEATVNYWREVGINARVEVQEFAKWLDIALTGCMRAVLEFAPERVDNPDCRDLPPGPPTFASSQVYQLNPSNEQLDFSRSARSISCSDPNSRVCDPENIDPLAKLAVTAVGEDRRIQLEVLADIFHDQVFSLPILDAKEFYGLSADLEWTPRDDKRLRANTMRYR
jgi:peptide/nickel transport system substrate-binding protein